MTSGTHLSSRGSTPVSGWARGGGKTDFGLRSAGGEELGWPKEREGRGERGKERGRLGQERERWRDGPEEAQEEEEDFFYIFHFIKFFNSFCCLKNI